jgi:hypothetical protein
MYVSATGATSVQFDAQRRRPDAQKSGTTLTELAQQKGVSKDDLVASIAKDLKANKPDGAPELSDAQLTDMATNIADGKPPQGPPPGGHGGGGFGSGGADRAQQNLSSLADLLGTDAQTLLSKLQSGEDLASLLGSTTSSTGYSSSAASSVNGGLVVDQYA